jgi:hypothetical protein
MIDDDFGDGEDDGENVDFRNIIKKRVKRRCDEDVNLVRVRKQLPVLTNS